MKVVWLTSARDTYAVDLVGAALRERLVMGIIVWTESSDRQNARAILKSCESHGLPCVLLPDALGRPENTITRKERDAILRQEIQSLGCDVLFLVGYMKLISAVIYERWPTLNLHPAPPLGPKGQWQDVMWSMIAVEAHRGGAMIHLTTADLDRGPVISYDTFPLEGEHLDVLRTSMRFKLREQPLSEIARTEGEAEPLFRAIRGLQFRRELPLVLATAQGMSSGSIRIVEGQVMKDGRYFPGGICLTHEVDGMLPTNDASPSASVREDSDGGRC